MLRVRLFWKKVASSDLSRICGLKTAFSAKDSIHVRDKRKMREFLEWARGKWRKLRMAFFRRLVDLKIRKRFNFSKEKVLARKHGKFVQMRTIWVLKKKSQNRRSRINQKFIWGRRIRGEFLKKCDRLDAKIQ